MKKLSTMRLDQLLPGPFNALHAKWIRVRGGRAAGVRAKHAVHASPHVQGLEWFWMSSCKALIDRILMFRRNCSRWGFGLPTDC